MAHRYQDWTDRLVEAARTGETIDLTGSTDNLPAEALREFIVAGAPHVDPAGLAIVGANIDGDLDLPYVTFSKPLRIIGCDISGSVDLTGASLGKVDLRGTSLKSMTFAGAEIVGDLVLADGFTTAGTVDGELANVGGHLLLHHAALLNKGGTALALHGAEIAASINATQLKALGAVHAIGIRVGAQFILNGAQLANEGGTALGLDGAEIIAGLFAGEGFTALGKVRAVSARVGSWTSFADARLIHDGDRSLDLARTQLTGMLDFHGATFTNPEGDALCLEYAEINGGVSCNRGFKAYGQVRADGIKVSGPVDFTGATLSKPGETALSLQGAEILGGLFARDGFSAAGAIRAPHLSVRGQLDMTDARLTNPNGWTMWLDGADVKGDFFVRGAFSSIGEFRAVALKVSGQMIVTGGQLINQGGDALCLMSASIQQMILGNLTVEGDIDFTRTSIKDLDTTSRLPGPLTASGWDIGDLRGPLHNNSRKAEEWLATAPAGANSVQPWHKLAEVYEKNGNPTGGRRLRFIAANRLTAQSPRWQKLTGYAYGSLVGHGYYPQRAAVWLLAVLVLACGLVAENRHHIVPLRPQDAATSVQTHAQQTGASLSELVTAETPCAFHPEYPCMSTVPFTLTNLLPTAGMSMTPQDWTIRSDSFLAPAMLLLRFVTWALAALLLAGVTGLLRKT